MAKGEGARTSSGTENYIWAGDINPDIADARKISWGLRGHI